MKIRISSRSPNGFFRLGRKWGPNPVDVEVTADEAKTLKAEKALVVVELGTAPAGGDDKKPEPSPADDNRADHARRGR